MTATPIPRTVAMTVYGDLETSTLRQLPSGRGGVASSSSRRRRSPPGWTAPGSGCARRSPPAGRPTSSARGSATTTGADDEPEDADGAPDEARRATGARRSPCLDVAELLRSGPLAGLRLDVLHGRLTPEEKDARCGLRRREIDVLVATTVIEVGVDVPNATVMVVMDADRFGVCQLHQLRGRVARGKHAGLCLLVTEARTASLTGQRLAAVAATSDGFELARSTSRPAARATSSAPRSPASARGMRMLSLLEDEELIATARAEATALLETERGLADHPGLAAEVAALATDERADWLEKA